MWYNVVQREEVRVSNGIEVIWEEPPEGRPGPTGRDPWYTEVLSIVMQRPGYWACIRRYEEKPKAASNAGSLLRKAYKRGKLPPGTWDVRTVLVDGVGKVYVRYGQNSNE